MYTFIVLIVVASHNVITVRYRRHLHCDVMVSWTRITALILPYSVCVSHTLNARRVTFGSVIAICRIMDASDLNAGIASHVNTSHCGIWRVALTHYMVRLTGHLLHTYTYVYSNQPYIFIYKYTCAYIWSYVYLYIDTTSCQYARGVSFHNDIGVSSIYVRIVYVCCVIFVQLLFGTSCVLAIGIVG